MKKSTLLSLLTAASITLTTAGTYAAWDILEASTTSKKVTFRKPVTIELKTDNEFSGTSTLGSDDLSVSGNVSFTVSNEPDLAKKLTIVPEVTGIEPSHVTISITDINSNAPDKNLSGNYSDGFVDTTLDTTNYTVKITPNDNHKNDLAGKEITVKLKATLSE